MIYRILVKISKFTPTKFFSKSFVGKIDRLRQLYFEKKRKNLGKNLFCILKIIEKNIEVKLNHAPKQTWRQRPNA